MMNNITLKFENPLSEDSLESLFDTLGAILPNDLYTEQKTLSAEGIETDYNLMYHETMGYHCYDMPVTRPLTVQEGKIIHSVLDKAIEGDYVLEMTADGEELQKLYKFNSFEGTIQEGEID